MTERWVKQALKAFEEVTQMQQIVRAVNTFDQAKVALKAARGVINSSMLDMASLNDGRAPLEHVQVLRDIDKAIAAMEAPQ